MTRHPTARRVHRQDSAPDDVFVAGVLETSAWAKQNSRMLVIGGIVAAVVILGTIFFITNRRSQTAEAASQLTQVRAVALSGNNQLAIRELEQFLSNYGGTPSGDEARLMLGSAYLQAGQAQQAQVEHYADPAEAAMEIGLPRGVLNIVRHEVDLHCPANAIPDFITVDLAGTDIDRITNAIEASPNSAYFIGQMDTNGNGRRDEYVDVAAKSARPRQHQRFVAPTSGMVSATTQLIGWPCAMSGS